MSFRVLKYPLIFLFMMTSILTVRAQITDASSADGKPREDYPLGIQETFAKQRIKAQEKQFSEMLGRSEEAAQISDEIYKSFETNKKLLPDDAKKAERLEKLVKKIRDELGSEKNNDDAADDSRFSYDDALKNIKDTSSQLFSELKKQGRFSISVAAVENSNMLLKLVRFVRQNQK